MFSKNKGNNAASNKDQASRPAVPSIISADLVVRGDLLSTGEIQIDGCVEGDIDSKVLLVGESADIKGEIRADTVRVHGTVTGQIKATTVNLAKSARVTGDIIHENLSIEKGAHLDGQVRRMEEPVKPATETPIKTTSEERVNLVVNKPANAPANARANAAKPVEKQAPGPVQAAAKPA